MSNIQESITSITKEHDTRRHLAVIVCMIAVATVLAVFWSLHIKGITLSSGDLICGMEEHTHTSDCYAWVPVDNETEDGSELEETESALETEDGTEADSETEAVSEIVTSGTEAASETVTESATESVSTETGTESLMEDGSEALTEEETEIPQVGDTKVIDGVEYVYTLICGMEEHSHTEDCYADEEDSEETESEETESEEETAESAALTAGVARVGTSRLGSSGPSSGVSAASVEEEGNSGGISVASLAASSGTEGDTYYFADTTTLADAEANPDESYIMYTIINGTYYVVSAEDGSLYACTDLTSYTTTADKETASTAEGIYIWELDSNGEPVFKFTTVSTDDDFADYRWDVASNSSSTIATDGSGDYTLYNEENAHYLASGIITYTDEYATTDILVEGQEVPLTDNGEIIYSISFSEFRHSNRLAQFYFDVYDASGNKIEIYVYYDNNYTSITNTLTVTSADSADYSSYTYGTLSISKDDEYEISVIREDTNVSIFIFNKTQDEMYVYVVDGLNLDDTIYSQLSVKNGKFSSSAQTFVASSSNESGTSISNAGTSDGSYTLESGDISSISDSSRSISGDFDVTYTLTNQSNGTDNEENFIIELNNGNGTYITVRADNFGWLYNYDGTVDIFEILTTFSDWSSWNSTMASGTSCTARVIRKGNTFLIITTSAGHTSIAYAEVSEFDGTVANVYLAGKNCTISDITYTDNTANAYIYSVVSSNNDPITLTVDSTDTYIWTVDDIGSDNEDIYLLGESDTASTLAWISGAASSATVTSTTSKTFSLARVREYTVFFDGTNGGTDAALYGVIYYRDAEQKTFTTSANASGTAFSVTVPTLSNTSRSGYVEYKLRGWVNVYTGDYYDISTYNNTDITVTGNTVFYADWEVADYNIGQDVNTVEVPDTSNFIRTYVFDYNDIFNLYSAVLDKNTTEASDNVKFITSLSRTSHSERWTVNDTSGTSGLLTNKTNLLDETLGFIFLGSGTDGSLALAVGRSRINSSSTVSGDANYYYLGNIYDGILGTKGTTVTTENNSLLNMLFTTDNTISDLTTGQTAADAVLGKTYVGVGYNLFQYDDDTGYYYYDSTQNAATYNQSKKTFYVYDYTEMTKASSSDTENKTDFLPFNYSASSTTYDVYTVNYWFGMQTEIDFYLPSNSNSAGGVNQTHGNDMVFKFSGDDDVWVCVDDVLVLDMGGMHGAVYGEINFSTGEVTVGQSGATKTTDANTNTISVDTSSTGVTTYFTTFTKGSHTLTVYYLERGASQSNLAMLASLTPVYSVEMAKVGASGEELDDVAFNLYSSSTFTDEYLVQENITTSSGKIRIDELIPLTTYYLVETSAANGYPLTGKYITIYVDTAGKATITVYSSDGSMILEQLSCDAAKSVNAASGARYLLNTLSVTGVTDNTYGSYYLVSFTYANYYEYELASTGSTGIARYLLTGETLVVIAIIGLIMIAFYQFVWVRKIHTMKNNEEYTGEQSRRSKNFAGMRGHPRERSITHGHARDRPGDR